MCRGGTARIRTEGMEEEQNISHGCASAKSSVGALSSFGKEASWLPAFQPELPRQLCSVISPRNKPAKSHPTAAAVSWALSGPRRRSAYSTALARSAGPSRRIPCLQGTVAAKGDPGWKPANFTAFNCSGWSALHRGFAIECGCALRKEPSAWSACRLVMREELFDHAAA